VKLLIVATEVSLLDIGCDLQLRQFGEDAGLVWP